MLLSEGSYVEDFAGGSVGEQVTVDNSIFSDFSDVTASVYPVFTSDPGMGIQVPSDNSLHGFGCFLQADNGSIEVPDLPFAYVLHEYWMRFGSEGLTEESLGEYLVSVYGSEDAVIQAVAPILWPLRITRIECDSHFYLDPGSTLPGLLSGFALGPVNDAGAIYDMNTGIGPLSNGTTYRQVWERPLGTSLATVTLYQGASNLGELADDFVTESMSLNALVQTSEYRYWDTTVTRVAVEVEQTPFPDVVLDEGRLRVLVNPDASALTSRWKFFAPRSGENGGMGVGKIWTGSSWVRVNG